MQANKGCHYYLTPLQRHNNAALCTDWPGCTDMTNQILHSTDSHNPIAHVVAKTLPSLTAVGIINPSHMCAHSKPGWRQAHTKGRWKKEG